MLKKTSDILYNTDILYNLHHVGSSNEDERQQELSNVFERLLEGGMFEAAKKLAALFQLPESKIALTQVLGI